MTVSRLARFNVPAVDTALSPVIRLAHVPGAQGDNILTGKNGVNRLEPKSAPALLVSYFYLKKFIEKKNSYSFRDWALDSGAFSAHASGQPVDLAAYIEKCRELIAADPTLTEVFALDVIGDHRESIKNTERMWDAGIPAIPCYHYGEPVDVLLHLAKTYPKIAIGGCARMRKGKKLAFTREVFARVWPKQIHGFGFGDEDSVMTYPFHSVDATSWELGPCGFGRWKSFGKLSVRGSSQNLRAEVEWYMRLEARARAKWQTEMAAIAAPPPSPPRRLRETGAELQAG